MLVSVSCEAVKHVTTPFFKDSTVQMSPAGSSMP